MSKSKEWLPDGAFDVKRHVLSQEQKVRILEAAKARDHARRDEFITRIELYIGTFHSAKKFQSNATPAKLRNRLRRIQKNCDSLMNLIQELDPYSTQLLSRSGRGPTWSKPLVESMADETVQVGVNDEEVEGFTFYEAAHAIRYIAHHVREALEQTKDHPKNRLEEWPRRNLTEGVGIALIKCLDVKPTFGVSGLFGDVLVAVLDCAGDTPKKGVDKGARDVRDLLKQASIDLAGD